ncbi:oxidation resistance protein 1-like isoform X2 [Watersipora subatra]|uniref:oxidation resistance protein 1-like isoform X2 n=1 Tax=Watersipora subatra TaxID=2589382 RepID=UPI00355B2C60
MSEQKLDSRQSQQSQPKIRLRNPFTKGSPAPPPPPDAISAISSMLEPQAVHTEDDPHQSPTKEESEKKKKKATPPPGTFEYVVKEGDKLRSLAAQFDTTPSVLKKLNRLTMDFLYPEQVLRIPDENYITLNAPSIKKSPSDLSSRAAHPHPLAKEEVVPKKVFPGHLVRSQASCHSIVDEMDLPPRPLSQDEAEYLDHECFERFIKIHSLYITEHNGPIDGVLLVTPNAVMFDPNVSNPLVMEKGADEFGMIAKMDTIMSASIYHDLDALQSMRNRKKDLTSAKPPVYRPDPPAPSAVSPAKSATKVTNLESGDVTPTTAINTDPQHSPDDAILASDAGEGQLSASSQNSSHVYSDVVGNETISIQNSALVNNDSHIVAENDTPVQKVLDDGTTDLTEKTGLLLNPSDLTMFSLPVDDTSCDLDSATLEGIAKGCEHTAEKPADTDSDISASNCRHAEAEMVPEGLAVDTHKQAAQEPSLYLCLRVGQPINKLVSKNCPIESYNKKKRPEYCFSIPREKVDLLYAFFIQWRPEVYDQEKACGNMEGFVAITEDGSKICNDSSEAYTEESKQLSHHLGHQVALDWEIVSWEEVRRRRTIDDFEKYVHLPELKSESLIITEDHVKKLLRCLPARVEGYPWELAFGSEQHGYSLHQMYRNMNDLDCPVLLIIETTENQIFGALSSCPFHMSESFYGTGESFLFTFVDGFKTYSWTGLNNFFNRGDHTCLIIGSGEGSYGLWLDEDIYLGRTQNCRTYANDPLTGNEEDFHIKRLEVWSFHEG